MPANHTQVAACVRELRESMELLMPFTDEEVLTKEPLSQWMKVTSSWLSKLAEPETMWEQNHSRCRRACPLGYFSMTHSIGHSNLTVPTMVNTSTVSSQMPGTLTISCQQAKTPLESPITPRQMQPPGFAEIARSLWGDGSPHITIDVPLGLTTSPGLLVGTAMATMTSTQMQQDAVTGITYLNTVMASMSLVSLGSLPMVVDCLMPAIEDLIDPD